jgi:hypothetical protein
VVAVQLLVLIVGGVIVGVGTSILLDRMGWSAKAKSEATAHTAKEAQAFAAGAAAVDDAVLAADSPPAEVS